MLLARQEFKRRQDGCVGAWVGRGAEDGMMLLVQSVFQSANHWKTISDSVKATFDAKDGGLNRCCSAHHLLASSKFHLKNFNRLCLARDVDFPYTLSSHNVSYATIMRNRIFASLPHIRKMERSILFLKSEKDPSS